MKKYIFFTGILIFLVGFVYGNGLGHTVKKRSTFGLGQTYKLVDSGVKRLYTNEINPKNFEEFISLISRNNRRVRKQRARITKKIFENSLKFQLDPLTLLALLAHESKYKWWKKGELDELGLGQVRPSVWFDKRNKDNLHKAGIVSRRKPWRLKYIGKGIHSTAHILVVYRTRCQKWKRQGKLRWRGHSTVNECMIRRYNGSRDTHKYYVRVTSFIGRYYFFLKNKKKSFLIVSLTNK